MDPTNRTAQPVALRGRIVTDYEVWPDGTLVLDGGSIREVRGEAPPDGVELHDYGDSLILPGFVDPQVNGAFGVDAATEPHRLPELSEALLSTGVTAYLPTIISAPEDLYRDALPATAEATRTSGPGAEILGVHLEGPFLAAAKRGAHPAEHVVASDPALLGFLLDLGPVRLLTLAPELEGARELAAQAAGRGAAVSAGHTEAHFETSYAAFDRYVSGVTHLFNAMSSLHHREPGLPGAAFAHPRVVCGLIADGVHVHPEMVGLAFRMLGPDRLYLTTDATAATGSVPGEYALATRKLRRDAEAVRLDDGTLAGGLLTLEECFKNILAFTGCTLPEAARMAAATPARIIGEGRRKGRLFPGYDADVTVLSPDLSVEAVWKGGEPVYPKGDAA